MSICCGAIRRLWLYDLQDLFFSLYIYLNFLVATSLVGHERELSCTHHQTCILHSQRQTQQSRPDVPFQQVDKGLTETAGGQKKSVQISIHDIFDWSTWVHSRHSRGSRPLSDPLVVTLRSGGPRRRRAESIHFWRVLVGEQRTWGGREEEEEEWKIRLGIAVQTHHTLTTRLQTLHYDLSTVKNSTFYYLSTSFFFKSKAKSDYVKSN